MINPQVLYTGLAAARVSGLFPFTGIAFDGLAWGIATGVAAWAVGQPQNLALVGAASGTAGVGSIPLVTTRMLVPPNTPAVMAALAGSGAAGPLGTALAMVVSNGLSSTFSTLGQYQGISSSVGVGTDITKVVLANGPSLAAILLGTMAAFVGGGGPSLPILSLGLGNGIAALLLGGTGAGMIAGLSSPTSAIGITNSVVV